MRAGIVVFPGTNRERDVAIALTRNNTSTAMLWHADTDLPPLDLVVLPGGFSHGDYLRSGAMAARSPIMDAVRRFAAGGGYVLGICNGFQILTEAGLLPGALLRNATQRFISRDATLRVERTDTAYTETLDQLEGEGRVAFRYAGPSGEITEAANRNGSRRNIAGIYSKNLRVLGLMPHLENLVDPLLGPPDGAPMFSSLALHAVQIAN
jgi:phosphoribosylformylglycinamidine (FGAM) synthase-like amidotransferase family enzyme